MKYLEIMEESKLNSEKIWKLWKKSKNSETSEKIMEGKLLWKKRNMEEKLNSENMDYGKIVWKKQ